MWSPAVALPTASVRRCAVGASTVTLCAGCRVWCAEFRASSFAQCQPGVFIRGPFSRCLPGASPPWRPRVRCRFSCWVASMCCPRMDVLCAYLEAIFNFCASPCPHVCDLLTIASLLAEWRITTTDTSCSAMHISPIRRRTSPSSGTPNWVSCRAPLPASIFLRSQSSCCCVVDFDVPALLLTRRGYFCPCRPASVAQI